MKLKAPANCGGASIGGVSIAVAADGSAEVPDHLTDELRSHGFSDWVDVHDQIDDPGALTNGDEFDRMDRTALFVFIGANGGGALPKNKTVELRAMARDAAAKKASAPANTTNES